MQSNSVNGQPDIANITVVTDERQVIVPQPITSVVEVNNPGPQGPVGPTGPQGPAGPSVPFTNIGNDVYTTTSSLQVTGSFLVSGSSTFTNIGPAIFSGSTAVSGSLTVNGYDVVTVNQTSSMSVATASYLNTLNQDLTFNGNLTLNGTASISTLVVNQTVLSTGSNQLGDNADDTQTLYGSVIVPTGSLTVSGNVSFGTSSAGFFWDNTNSRLGIGTATPAYGLDVNETARVSGTAAAALTVERTTSTSNIYIQYKNATTSWYAGQTRNGYFGVGLNPDLGISTIFNITQTSNILIGTTTDSGARLHISGSTSQALLIASSSNGPALFVSGSGNVGIGTSTPAYNLHVTDSIAAGVANSTNGTIRIERSSGAVGLIIRGSDGNIVGGGFTPVYEPYKYADASHNFNIGHASIGNYNWYAGSNATLNLNTHLMRLTRGGNLLIGTTTDAGFKLDVNGTARVRGTGTTSATTALTVINSDSTTLLQVQDNGYIRVGSQATNAFRIYATDASGDSEPSGLNLVLNSRVVSQAQAFNVGMVTINGPAGTATTGTQNVFLINKSFSPTSGTATYALASITGTINQTGGANGITRGLYIQPTLTSAADFRAIETTAGNVLFQSGSTPLLFVSGSGNVGISTATPSFRLDVSGSTRFKFSPSGADLFTIDGATTTRFFIVENSNGFVGIGSGYTTSATPSTPVDIRGNTSIRGGSATVGNAFIVTNTTPTTLLTVQNNGQVSFTSPTMSLAASQSAFSISPIISASNIVGGQYYGVNITPTFFQTTGSQTETAFRVAATFTSSNATATSGSNIIADFGSTSAGSQLTVTDVTSGSIYMVNDVSGIPIIEATSNWDVNIYDFPNKVFEKTGSQVNIYGTMRISGSFILPLSQSVAPQTGSAYWSGSLLFIYDGTRYRSSSFA